MSEDIEKLKQENQELKQLLANQTAMRKYQQSQATFAQMQDIHDKIFGKKHGYDKLGNTFSFVKVEGEWKNMIFKADAYAGKYGSSGCSPVGNETLGKYLAQAMTQLNATIYQTALDIAEIDAKAFKYEAEQEARIVLGELGNESKIKN